MENEQEKNENDNALALILQKLQEMDTKLSNTVHRMERIENENNEFHGRMSILEGAEELDQKEEGSEVSNESAIARRKTKFQRMVADNKSLANRHQVQVVKEPPSYKHIYLKSTELSEYVKFVNDWMDYGMRHGIALEPAQIVSRTIRQRLLDKYELSEQQFQGLTAEQFCHLMAGETRVFSKINFSKTMKHALRAIKPMDWGRITPANHEDYYNSILRLSTVFERTLGIMLEMNSDFVPDLEDREYGLVQVFLRKIDRAYVKEILAEMPRIKEKNYATVLEFIKAFKEKAREHYELSRTMTRIPYRGSSFNSFVEDSDGATAKLNNLHAVEKVQVHEEQCEDLDADSSSECVEAACDKPAEGDPDDLFMDDLNEEEKLVLHAVEPAKAKGDAQYPPSCIYYAIFGDCKRGIECKNKGAHNLQAAERTRKWLRMKLDEHGPRSREIKLLRRGPTNM